MPYYTLTGDGPPVGGCNVKMKTGDPGMLDWCPDCGSAPSETVPYECTTGPDDPTPGESFVYPYAGEARPVYEY